MTELLPSGFGIYWCDGSEAEKDRLIKECIYLPASWKRWNPKTAGREATLHHSNPNDVARTEDFSPLSVPLSAGRCRRHESLDGSA